MLYQFSVNGEIFRTIHSAEIIDFSDIKNQVHFVSLCQTVINVRETHKPFGLTRVSWECGKVKSVNANDIIKNLVGKIDHLKFNIEKVNKTMCDFKKGIEKYVIRE